MGVGGILFTHPLNLCLLLVGSNETGSIPVHSSTLDSLSVQWIFEDLCIGLATHSLAAVSRGRLSETEPKWFVFETF